MKRFLLFTLLFTVLTYSSAFSQWVEVWSDEFDYNGLPDSEKWSYDVGGHGWGNGEDQYYTEDRIENAEVSDGYLTITAVKEEYEGNAFTSARLVTKNKGDWLYGRVEVKADLPEGRGIWPAIWMLPTNSEYGTWPASGEIDIMEYVGHQPDIIHGTVHTDAFNHNENTEVGETISVPDCEETFHVYALEWDRNTIDVFVDSTKYFTFEKEEGWGYAEWPFDKEFHLLLNIAVGGEWGGREGIDSTIFPQEMLIDYVRVFKPDTSGPFSLNTGVYGNGSISISPFKSEYDLRDTVTLTASPSEGYVFREWGGDVSSSEDATVEIVITGNTDVSAFFAPEGELIVNGDFSSGSQGWDAAAGYEGGQASGSVEDGEYHVSITNGGDVSYAVQFNYPGLELIQGHTYQVSFDARAVESRSIAVSMNQNYDPWNSYFNQEFTLGTDNQTFTFEFTMEEASDENSRLEFDLGISDADVYIDNVSCRDVNATGVDSWTGEVEDNGSEKLRPDLCNIPGGIRIGLNTSSQGSAEIGLFSTKGRCLRSYTSSTDHSDKIISFSNLSNGVYVLRIKTKSMDFSKRVTISE